jgi:hypothetical protein
VDGPLADDLFFALHDPFSGRARGSEGRSDVCLAAALITELLLSDHVRVTGGATGGALALVGRPQPEEPLAQVVLARLERQLVEGPRLLADWLADVTPSADALVCERLLRSGRGVAVRRRRFGLIGGSVVAATEATVHELALDRLAAYLRNAVTPEPTDVVLAALVMLADPRPDPLTGTPAAKEFVLSRTSRLPDGVRAVLLRAERVLGGDRLNEQERTAPRTRESGRRSAG